MTGGVDVGRDREGTDHTRLFRWAAMATLVAASSSAAVFALLDASTIANRVGGENVAARPMWLHTFSVAVLTCLVAARALWSDAPVGNPAARLTYLATAIVNMTVPALGLAQDDLHVIVPTVHCALAGLLVVMTMLARPSSGEAP